MGSRRRNLLILAFVLVLTVASAYAISQKRTVLGLDLRGGTELVYQARPTAQVPNPSPQDIDRAIEIMRERTDQLGVSEPEIAKFAEKQKVDCGDLCSTNGPTYYLFAEGSLELLAGPAEKEEDLFIDSPDGKQPDGTEVVTVPQGVVVVRAEPPGDDPATDIDESAGAPAEYFVLKDRPELTGDEIQNPEQNFDPTSSQPNVTFDFTDDGQQAFQDVTRRIALRGAESAPPGACVSSDGGDAYSQHFAIILDNEVVSRPIINFCENPEGIDGRNGAQISGSFTLTEAQDLAKFLQIGALPVNLTLISQSTVSATLGQQALDQGLKAGLGGLILVVLFLIAYYRILGVVAALGLLVYAVFFYAMIKVIPITLTLPGIAGLVLTIGVAADANVVIFERIKEEARAGKSLASAIATGYRKGIATIVDANVITLITAFILFVLATAGVKGFAFTLLVGTLVSLVTAVLFTRAILGFFGRTRVFRSPRALGAGEQRVRWHFDFSGASRWFFSMSGAILLIGASSLAINQLNLGIDFEPGARIDTGLVKPATVDDVRAALEDAKVPDAGGAEIQEVSNEQLGENAFQIKGKFSDTEVNGPIKKVLSEEFGLKGGEEGFNPTVVGPTFGEQVTRTALIAIVFSLLVISGYVAIRFEGKYAIPVIIALLH